MPYKIPLNYNNELAVCFIEIVKKNDLLKNCGEQLHSIIFPMHIATKIITNN